MYSSRDNRCSHRLGSPIRKSPDHRLLASPRGLSQLATSFFACLRQGIHTHALSSLTIKLTPHTSTASRSTSSGTPFAEPSFKRRSGRTCCYPSDIQLSKINQFRRTKSSTETTASAVASVKDSNLVVGRRLTWMNTDRTS